MNSKLEVTVLNSKKERLGKLYEDYKNEFKGNEIVLGNGNIDCKLMLVGEAPGKDEVKLGMPFVGMAGKNLDEFLNTLGIERNDLYITNAVKYRLSKINDSTGRVINRPANRQDIVCSRSYLLEEINIIKPTLIITLGNVPLRSLTGEFDLAIGELHGKLKIIDLPGKQYSLFPLYHPASIIYNKLLKQAYENDIYELKYIMNRLGGFEK